MGNAPDFATLCLSYRPTTLLSIMFSLSKKPVPYCNRLYKADDYFTANASLFSNLPHHHLSVLSKRNCQHNVEKKNG